MKHNNEQLSLEGLTDPEINPWQRKRTTEELLSFIDSRWEILDDAL